MTTPLLQGGLDEFDSHAPYQGRVDLVNSGVLIKLRTWFDSRHVHHDL